MTRTPHTGVHPGKRVRVELKSGEIFIDRFVDRTGTWVWFRERGKVRKGQIKAFGIYREAPR